jgi:hypothetical protein
MPSLAPCSHRNHAATSACAPRRPGRHHFPHPVEPHQRPPSPGHLAPPSSSCCLTPFLPSPMQIVAAILAIAGIVMMTYADGFHSHSVIGIALVVGSASMSALYKVCACIWRAGFLSWPHHSAGAAGPWSWPFTSGSSTWPLCFEKSRCVQFTPGRWTAPRAGPRRAAALGFGQGTFPSALSPVSVAFEISVWWALEKDGAHGL